MCDLEEVGKRALGLGRQQGCGFWEGVPLRRWSSGAEAAEWKGGHRRPGSAPEGVVVGKSGGRRRPLADTRTLTQSRSRSVANSPSSVCCYRYMCV